MYNRLFGVLFIAGVSGRSRKIGFTSNPTYSNSGLVMIIAFTV